MIESGRECFDVQHVIDFKNGNQDAFSEIFNYYKKHIYWIGTNFFNNEELAKDLVQSVFLEIYQSIQKLREVEKFYPWMNRIAYTRCLQMVRHNKKDSLHYTSDMGEEFVEEVIEDKTAEDVLDNMQKEQIRKIIIGTLETLPPEQRVVCYLRLFEELSWTQISEVTQIPVGTASSYLTRIKPILKNALIKNGFTSASCTSLLILPNIAKYYKAFTGLKEMPVLEMKPMAKVPFYKIHIPKVLLNSIHMVAQIPVATALVATISLPVLVNAVPRYYEQQESTVESGEPAQIINVEYPTQLTNTPFQLDVKLSNENYEHLLLNNKSDLTVYENGTHEVTLENKGKVIASKTIEITNLDRDVPLITKVIYEKDIVTLVLKDEHNQINFDSIQFFENGVLTNRFTLDKEKSEVYISREKSNDNLFQVSDTVGNVLDATVKFYKKNAE